MLWCLTCPVHCCLYIASVVLFLWPIHDDNDDDDDDFSCTSVLISCFS